jgi:peptide/bleomycin uptake transporter
MFQSFFPNPRLFFPSAAIWGIVMVAVWYTFVPQMMAAMGIVPADPDNPVIGLEYFWEPDFLFWYAYFVVGVGIFYAFWRFYAPHPWMNWSILGSALIIFVTYYNVQVSVVINNWYNPFYDLVQKALSAPNAVSAGELYGYVVIFLEVAVVAVIILVANAFFVSHWTFRWRTAMNNFYMSRWDRLRGVEGASQRVQEDTMRFAQTLEPLGISFLRSVMTLIAFLPILFTLSKNITELPFVGVIPAPLVTAAVVWSLFGTVVLAIIGIRLPGLQFRNQRVEAAYRKELVYGEDVESRAQPPTVAQLFEDVRRNYFRIFLNYTYFNFGLYVYFQLDNIFGTLILVPTIAAGAITFGLFQQILGAFGQVSSSFQYLANSWTTIVELASIFKRLRAFESVLYGDVLHPIEKEVESVAQASVRQTEDHVPRVRPTEKEPV